MNGPDNYGDQYAMPVAYPQLILHVGPPRAGSTTLQKHIFPKLKNHLSLSKLPYVFHKDAGARYRATHQVSETGYLGISIPRTQRRLTELHNRLDDSGEEARQELFTIIRSLAAFENYKEDHATAVRLQTLRHALAVAAEMACRSKKRILFASESLSNSTYALAPDTRNGKWMTDPHESEIITKEWKALTDGDLPIVLFALRSPISHLCSRYMRYRTNLREGGVKPLKPEPWIAKQVEIDRSSRQHSGLFPALHKSYISHHSKLGFIRPYSFKDLVGSRDVCATIGLSGEHSIPFTVLPKENKITIKPGNMKLLESRITAALDHLGYLDMVLNEQVME